MPQAAAWSRYTYIVTAGKLPNGLSLSSAGVISGTPTTTGTSHFTIQATDSSTGAGPYNVALPYSIVIFPKVFITTTVVPTYWTVNKPGYTQTIATTGGSGSATFTVNRRQLAAWPELEPRQRRPQRYSRQQRHL